MAAVAAASAARSQVFSSTIVVKSSGPLRWCCGESPLLPEENESFSGLSCGGSGSGGDESEDTSIVRCCHVDS